VVSSRSSSSHFELLIFSPKFASDPRRDDAGFEEEGGVVGAEVADGVNEIVKVVRRQIGRGADWIKIYAGDYFFSLLR